MATHSSTLAWRIPWMEQPGGLQFMRSKESDMTEQLHFLSSFHFKGIKWYQREGRGAVTLWGVFQPVGGTLPGIQSSHRVPPPPLSTRSGASRARVWDRIPPHHLPLPLRAILLSPPAHGFRDQDFAQRASWRIKEKTDKGSEHSHTW